VSDGPDPLAGFPVTPPPLRRPVLFDQTWVDLTFIHWPVRPDAVAHLYPPGTRPDVFADGLTYVALVPFRMGHTALGTGPRLPYFGVFAETNVRLYSIDDAGRHGVLFSSLETWLTARWGAHTRKAGRTWWVPNEHGPWSLRAADLVEFDDDLIAASGVPVAGPRLRCLYSPGVRTRFGRPTVVAQ
jgi:uncharacterized protein YqjF (DUF2071 family)